MFLVGAGIALGVVIEVRRSQGDVERGSRLTTIMGSSSSSTVPAHAAKPRDDRVIMRGLAPTAVAVIVVLSCVLAGVTVLYNDTDHQVEEIDGGIVWILDFQYRSWNKSHVMIHDNHANAYGNLSFAHWTLENSCLDRGVWSAFMGNVSDFGEDNISMTIVDSTGDGIADYGDAIIFVVSGQSFRSDRTYFAFVTDQNSLGWSGWELKFTFKSGSLSSYSVSRVIGL